MDNLFANTPHDAAEEVVERLAGNGDVRIERIVSTGQASPPDFWYDQAEREWVVLLKGAARLAFRDEGQGANRVVELNPGDWVDIPPHQKHQVEWTVPNEPTVWLAVFFGPDSAHDS